MKNLIKLLVLATILVLLSCKKETTDSDNQYTHILKDTNIYVLVLNSIKVNETTWVGASTGYDYVFILDNDTTLYHGESAGKGSTVLIPANSTLKVEATSIDTSTYMSISAGTDEYHIGRVIYTKHYAELVYSNI